MFILARDRALIALAGADRTSFLQGIVSNDVEKAREDRAIYAAFLTPQGKYLHDIFIAAQGDRLLIDCESSRRPDLLRRLSLYKLRAKVTLAEENGLAVGLYFGADALAGLGLPAEAGRSRAESGGVVFVDPRLAALGARAILPPGQDAGGERQMLPTTTGCGFPSACRTAAATCRSRRRSCWRTASTS